MGAVARADPPDTDWQPVSRAYHKMREIGLTCAAAARGVAHLCEAPGGFVQATAELAGDAWRWVGVSLVAAGAPAWAVDDARGTFVAGSVFDPACAQAVAEAGVGEGTADLVTGDGAVEMDHDRLEEEHWPLLVAQTEWALRFLRDGGCLVLKFFEGATPRTQAWLAWVSTCFTSVSVIRPRASRATNSERYLVARDKLSAECPADWDRVAPARARTADALRVLDRLADDQTRALEAAFATLAHQNSRGR